MELNSIKKEELSIKDLVLRSKDFFGYIIYRRKIVFIAMFIGGLLGFTYSFFKKPIYSASLSFALEDKGSGRMNSISMDSPFGIDLSGGTNGGAFTSTNLPELFLSRTMVEATLLAPVIVDNKKISLAEMYLKNNDWREKWKDEPKFKTIEFLPNKTRSNYSRTQDSILGIIYEDIIKNALTVVQKDKKISIIVVNVKSCDELFAKYFTEALAKQVSDFYIDYKSKKARENVDILVKQTDSVRNQLNSAITGVAVSVDNTFNLNPALNVKRTSTSRKQVDVQANTFILTELVKQAELAKVTLRKETPLIQVIDTPILPLENNKIGAILAIFLGSVTCFVLTMLFLVFKNIFKQLMI